MPADFHKIWNFTPKERLRMSFGFSHLFENAEIRYKSQVPTS